MSWGTPTDSSPMFPQVTTHNSQGPSLRFEGYLPWALGLGCCGNTAQTVPRFWPQTPNLQLIFHYPPTFGAKSQFFHCNELSQHRTNSSPLLALRHFLVWHTLFTSFTLFPYLARGKGLGQHSKSSFSVLAHILDHFVPDL